VGACAVALAALAVGGTAAVVSHKKTQAELLGQQSRIVKEQAELKARLLKENGGEGAATVDFAHASVTHWDDKALLDFKRSGRLLLIDGMGPKPDLISVPESQAVEWLLEANRNVGFTNLKVFTPDGKALPFKFGQADPRRRKAFLDEQSGKLTVGQEVYDLQNASMTSPDIAFEKGSITRIDFPREGYVNTVELIDEGRFRSGSYFKAMEIAPETFGYQGQLVRDPREGTLEVHKESLLQDKGVFSGVQVERKLRYPSSPQNQKLLELEPKQIGGHTTVAFKNGAVLKETWSEEGPTLTLNGKLLDKTRLGSLSERGIELVRTEFHDSENLHRKAQTTQFIGHDGTVSARQVNHAYLWGHGQYDFTGEWTPEKGMTSASVVYSTATPNEHLKGHQLALDDSGQVSYRPYASKVDILKFVVHPAALASPPTNKA
jgi:hypothetical protein